jgi:UDP-N-acetylmuramyl pentapeptide phosphotransferase/UDP-N-acetylglucosamine-1-phosphate transferase
VRVDIPYVDALFQFQLVSFICSLIAIAGLTNAVNIIDRFNGKFNVSF